MSERITVAIVDDDPFIVASLATILGAEDDIAVTARGNDGDEAVALYGQHAPDVLLLDIQMPRCDGLAAAERILGTHPDARIVLLTTFSDDDYIIRALRIGAKGYLVKQDVATIAPALRSVMAGQSVLGSEVVGKMGALMATNAQSAQRGEGGEQGRSGGEFGAHGDAFASLTDRERAVVELVAQGLDNREIAAKLYLGEGTVRNHISTILQKLQLKNRTQIAVRYYNAQR